AQNRVDSRGDVRDENESVGGGPQKFRQRGARLIQQPFKIAHKEPHRLPLEPVADVLLKFKDGPRAASERAVVQKNDLAIKQPEPRIAHGPIQELYSFSGAGHRFAVPQRRCMNRSKGENRVLSASSPTRMMTNMMPTTASMAWSSRP